MAVGSSLSEPFTTAARVWRGWWALFVWSACALSGCQTTPDVGPRPWPPATTVEKALRHPSDVMHVDGVVIAAHTDVCPRCPPRSHCDPCNVRFVDIADTAIAPREVLHLWLDEEPCPQAVPGRRISVLVRNSSRQVIDCKASVRDTQGSRR